MAPICKLQTLVVSLCQPVSYFRSFATLVSAKQDACPSVDPELLKEIYKIPFAPRSPPAEQPSTSTLTSTSTSTSTTSNRTSSLSVELSALLARVFRKGASVTTILSDTMPTASRIALQKWRRNQIALVFGGDEAAFNVEMLRVMRTGTHLHACVARHLCGEPITGEQLAPNRERHSIEGFWNSLYPIFEDITAARLHEVHLAHPLLYYTGIFDSLIEYKCAIECKCIRIASCTTHYEPDLEAEVYSLHVYLGGHCARVRVGETCASSTGRRSATGASTRSATRTRTHCSWRRMRARGTRCPRSRARDTRRCLSRSRNSSTCSNDCARSATTVFFRFARTGDELLSTLLIQRRIVFFEYVVDTGTVRVYLYVLFAICRRQPSVSRCTACWCTHTRTERAPRLCRCPSLISTSGGMSGLSAMSSSSGSGYSSTPASNPPGNDELCSSDHIEYTEHMCILYNRTCLVAARSRFNQLLASFVPFYLQTVAF